MRQRAQGLVRVTVRAPASRAAGCAVSQSKGYKAQGHTEPRRHAQPTACVLACPPAQENVHATPCALLRRLLPRSAVSQCATAQGKRKVKNGRLKKRQKTACQCARAWLKIASRKFFCKTGETVFVQTAQTVAAYRENARLYDESALGAVYLNTPRLITNTDGIPVWTWDGEAFGNTPPQAEVTGAGPFTFNLRFPGQYYDAETNLNNNYFRDYDPSTGHYVESDPLGLRAGVSTFSYGGGNPTSYTDPFGLILNGMTFNGNNITIDLRINYQDQYGNPLNNPGLALAWNMAIASAWSGNYLVDGVMKNVQVNVSSGCTCTKNNAVRVIPGMPSNGQDLSNFNSLSTWGNDSTFGDVIHEAGHLMGINHDYYFSNGTAQPGWEGNIMATTSGTVDARNINEILKFNSGPAFSYLSNPTACK